MSKLPNPGTINRRLKRHQQVVHVLVKHGFGQLVDRSAAKPPILAPSSWKSGRQEDSPLTR
jgi:hypothetical protein